jgi:hypothetical protein
MTGTWDVVVTNPDTQSATLPNGFTINQPTGPPPTVTGITPDRGEIGEEVHITNLAGSNFQAGATAKLSRMGQSDINAINLVLVNDTQIVCDFNLSGTLATGPWNVVVINPDNQSGTLTNGFTVDPVQDPRLLVYLPVILNY